MEKKTKEKILNFTMWGVPIILIGVCYYFFAKYPLIQFVIGITIASFLLGAKSFEYFKGD